MESPIVGTGDLYILRQSGTLRLAAANTYTGKTYVGAAGDFSHGSASTIYLDADNALPATTTLVEDNTAAVITTIHLGNTTQRIAGFTTGLATGAKTILSGAGTVRFGMDEDEAISLTNLYVTAGATLAYAGAGTVTPYLEMADGTMFALESGSLAVPTETALGYGTLKLDAGRTVSLADTVTALSNDIVLYGNATLSVAASTVSLTGDLTRTTDDTTLTLTGTGAVTFGADDAVLRVFGAPIVASDAMSVTLDGWVEALLDPASYTKTANCVIFGGYSGVPSGNLALDNQARGVRALSELGTAETITLANGSRLIFYADTDSVASYSVSLDATSSLELGGGVEYDLTGATFAGAGTIHVQDAGVRLKGDFTAFTLAVTGDVFVPDGETLTVAAVSGTLRKTGAGTLRFVGTSDAHCHLMVAEGVARLGLTDDAKLVGNVTVDVGATLVLDGDEQINNGNSVFLNGTWDLNGHSERLGRYYNTPPKDTYREEPQAALVNRSTATAVLTTLAETAFFGRITEEPGRIELATESGLVNPFGPASTAAPSKITATDKDGCVFPYERWSGYRFVIYDTVTSGQQPQLAEIQLTYQGRPVALKNTGFSSSGSDSTHQLKYLLDGRADTYWQSTGTTNVWLQVSPGGFPAVDGYRLAANKWANAPKNWDVYAYRAEPSGWFLVDRRRDEQIMRTDFTMPMMSTNFYFSFAGRPQDVLDPSTDVELVATSAASARMRVSSTSPTRVGKVTGSAAIRIEDGSSFGAADLTEWTGHFQFKNEERPDVMARILLRAEQDGPTVQPVRVTAENANVSIENESTTPVSVLVDDTMPGPLRGRLADGNGPLGLVKRGAGSVTLGTGNSANTGVTSIEEGCLKICSSYGAGRTVTARYLRIWPSKNNVNAYDGNHYNWGMNDFQLLDAAGNRIAFPNGTTVSTQKDLLNSSANALIDGDIKTRCLVKNTDEEESAKTGACSWVVIDMKEPVAFCGYQWYTAHRHSADKNRVPIVWTLEISDDGENWSVVDAATDPYNLNYGDDTIMEGFLRGPYGLRGENDGIQPLTTLPAEFFADVTARSTHAPALKARYFRFQPNETYDPTADVYAYGWMISEFSLFRNGARVDWPADATPTLMGSSLNTSNGSILKNFCNNVCTGELVQARVERVFVNQLPSYVTVDAGEEVTFDAYGFFSAALGGRDARVPTAWTFSVSSDGTTWHVVDDQAGRRDIVHAEYAFQGQYSVANRFPLLNAASATDALGDCSPVAIASGASLWLDSAYERFGTLSGAGTVSLARDAVAEVNACIAGTFSGAVNGPGTLAVCGVAMQTFDNATLDVLKLELNGGTGTGTAVKTGNLEIAFNGGAWMGTLDVSGTLTATGTPVFVLPATVPNGFRQTLFTYSSVDAATAQVLSAATVTGELPKGIKAKVLVGEKSCILSAAADGTILIFR